MSNPKIIKRLQNLIWILLYAGLLTLVLGLFTERTDEPLGWTMVIFGGLAAAVGVVLIFVRARLEVTDA
jgi:cyanate permease